MSTAKLQASIERAILTDDPGKIDKALQGVVDVSLPTGDPKEFVPLEYAAAEGRSIAVRHLLLKGADPRTGKPLNTAVFYGRAEIARQLIAAGANVSALSRSGYSPLMDVLREDTPDYFECVELLVRSGADVNAVQANGIQNVVMSCAQIGSIRMMEVLFAAGARLNDVCRRGTVLTIAVELNQPPMVEWLLRHGADPALRVPETSPFPKIAGLTALEMARKLGFRKCASILEALGPEAVAAETQTALTKPAASRGGASRRVSIESALDRLGEALKDRKQLKQAKLQRPATDAQIAAWEKKMGRSLPADLAKAYGVHNGQKSPDFGLFPPPDDPDDERFDWLSLAESQSEWSVWQDVGESEPGRTCAAHPGVRELWWHSGWIPFASNGGGDVLCVDTSPAKGGKKGQVISVSHESGARRLLAPSLAAYLAEVAESISSDETIDSD